MDWSCRQRECSNTSRFVALAGLIVAQIHAAPVWDVTGRPGSANQRPCRHLPDISFQIKVVAYALSD